MRHKFLIMLVILVALFCFIGEIYIISHEAIHRHIFNKYEVESIVEIGFLHGSVAPLKRDMWKCNDSCKLQHTLNDVVGYNVAVFMICIILLLLTYFLYKET